MGLHYFPKNGAIRDGCSLFQKAYVPPIRHIANIYLRRWRYGWVIEEAITVGFYEYRAVFQLRAGPDALLGASS
jgi:hypothetical protein